MKRTYEVKGAVTQASGFMAFLVRGKPVEGVVVVEAAREDFAVVVGKKFIVSGEVKKAPMMGMMTKRTFGPTVVVPDSKNIVIESKGKDGECKIVVSVADDAKQFAAYAYGKVSGAVGVMLSSANVVANGKMMSEEG
jgi:hypothetical protein